MKSVAPERKGRVAGGPSAAVPHLATCFLRHRTSVLLRRGVDGRWDAVSARIEGEPADAVACRAVNEVTGVADPTPDRVGDPVDVDGGDRTVHPFRFDVDSRAVVATDHGRTWVSPPEIRERPTVPGLWDAYEAVAPTVETVATDRTHGSAWLSVRALEVLRDRAAVADDYATVAAVARDLRTARPSMAAVATRIDRVMAGADRTPDAVRERADAAASAALDAGEVAAANAADRCGEAVVTLSRSGTVRAALDRARPAVLLGESRPGGEGADVAADLAAAGLDVTLTTDAALAAELADRPVDAAVVGADAVLADGSVVNKVGTRALALAADREGVPLWVVATTAKIRPDERVHQETADPADIYDGDGVTVAAPVFDRTPADLVGGVVTERGVLDADDVRAVAATHRDDAAWVDRD
jgi:translation initiation factor 2B subunit (eIF-2B alpha/beta/delta family)